MSKIEKGSYRGFAMPLAVLVFSVFFTGCQLLGPAAPTKPAEDVIREGIAKLMGVTSYSYEVSVKGDMKDEAGSPVKFDVGMDGKVDVKDVKDPKVTLKLAGTVSDSGAMSGEGSFDIRLNKEAIYFNILKLDLKGMGEIPAEVTEMFNKWWMYPMDAEMLDGIATSLPTGEDSAMTPEQLKVKKLIEETNFFGTPKYVGAESVKGENCYRYAVTLDKKAFVAFAGKMAELQGESVTETELAEMEESLKNVEIAGDVYVGVNSGVMQQFEGTVTVKDEAGESAGTVALSMKLWDVGKAVSFEAPQGATAFPLEDFMAGFMGGAAVEPTYDDSYMPVEGDLTDFTMDESLLLE